jgi:16S rRNA (uracil1498-N3)-methyltransferase
MRQFILPADWDGGPTCRIEGGRAHYVARVLRLGPGDCFPARDSGGAPWSCTVLRAEPDCLILSVSAVEETSPEGAASVFLADAFLSPRIVLVMGLPKGAKMDLVVRQATEAGVSAVVPLISARSTARSEESGPGRRTRWDRVVREALQQSGSSVVTKVLDPVSMTELPKALDFLGLGPGCPRILLHEAPLAQSSMHGYLNQAPEALALCVGPEGGFSPAEVDFLAVAGFKPLRFAGAILRAETAALYAVAAAQIILSERSSWIPKPL